MHGIMKEGKSVTGCAQLIMKHAHRGQMRKFTNQPYDTHPMRVGLQFEGDMRAAGFVHDVVEDTDWTIPDLLAAGLTRAVTDIVYFLTKREGEGYFDYILRLQHNPDAVQIKLADLRDNLQEWPKEGSMKDKWRITYYMLSGGQYPPA